MSSPGAAPPGALSSAKSVSSLSTLATAAATGALAAALAVSARGLWVSLSRGDEEPADTSLWRAQVKKRALTLITRCPADIVVSVISSPVEASEAVEAMHRRLLERASSDGSVAVVGLDCEWTPAHVVRRRQFRQFRQRRRKMAAPVGGVHSEAENGADAVDIGETEDENADGDGKLEEEDAPDESEADLAAPARESDVELLQLFDGEEVILIRFPHCLERRSHDDTGAASASHEQSTVPAAIARLLMDPDVIKSGAAIGGDVAKLRKMAFAAAPGNGVDAIYSLAPRQQPLDVIGAVDLQPLAQELGRAERGFGLATMAEETLGVLLDKQFDVRCGDWGMGELSAHQQNYAALDAWASREVLLALFSDHGGETPIVDWLSPYIDRLRGARTKSGGTRNSASSAGGSDQAGKILRAVRATPLRKSALYENCVMQDPDGELLCICNEKKLNWYLDRNLATRVEDAEVPTIRLNFRPGGPGHKGEKYYLAEKGNFCVVCGSGRTADGAATEAKAKKAESTGVVRHAVVPPAFRRHFPVHLKSRSSHDVVLLCVPCTHKCGVSNARYKRELMQRFGIQSARRRRADAAAQEHPDGLTEADADLRQIGRLALALRKHYSELPGARIDEMVRSIREFVTLNVHGSAVVARAGAMWLDIGERTEKSDDNGSGTDPGAAAGRIEPDNATDPAEAGSSSAGESEYPIPDQVLEALETLSSAATQKLENPAERWEAGVVRRIAEEAVDDLGPDATEEEREEAGDDAICDFARGWRQNFLDNMRPRFMPEGWSADHRPRAARRD
jgi:3'-5' exonuclease